MKIDKIEGNLITNRIGHFSHHIKKLNALKDSVMKPNPDFIAPCGLYCGVCAIYIAHRDNNKKFKARLVNLYKGNVPEKGTLPNSNTLFKQ